MNGDFDITLITLSLDDASMGDGVVSVGSDLDWDDDGDQLTIATTSSRPIPLANVRPVE